MAVMAVRWTTQDIIPPWGDVGGETTKLGQDMIPNTANKAADPGASEQWCCWRRHNYIQMYVRNR